jgi:hypothetical protein
MIPAIIVPITKSRTHLHQLKLKQLPTNKEQSLSIEVSFAIGTAVMSNLSQDKRTVK